MVNTMPNPKSTSTSEGNDALSAQDSSAEISPLAKRFRGYLPVVVDIETGGFNAATDAMLEIAATVTQMDDNGRLVCGKTYSYHLTPFEGANIEDSALQFTGIKLNHPLRPAQEESLALRDLFKHIRGELKAVDCKRAILTGHNASFDLGFLNAAIARCDIKRSPFHPFSCFDTASLAGLACGQTVLAKACLASGLDFDNEAAHSAIYDTEKTAELFCHIVNRWLDLGGWPPPTA